MKNKKNTLSLLIQGLLLSGTTVAVAQETNEVKTKVEVEVEVITVEARRRVEPLQEVPVAVTVMTAEQIERSHNIKIESLDKFAPNVELGKMQFGGGAITAGIRGISYAEVERTFEPAVGVAVDGVFFGTGVGAMADMFDVSSIEILRGPQGTLFGRNTMGGVINIKRKKPTEELGLKAEIGYGSYNARHVKAVFNTGMLNDQLAAKFSVFKNQNDLFTENFYTGEHEDGLDQLTVAAKILYTPTEEVEVVLAYDKVDDNSNYPQIVNLSGSNNLFCFGLPLAIPALGNTSCQSGTAALAATKGYDYSDNDVDFSNSPFSASIQSDLWSLNVSVDINDELTFESITGYQDVKDRLIGEVTGIPDLLGSVGVFLVDRQQEYDQLSQEIRLSSDYSGPINFVSGLYYFESEYSMQPQTGIFFGNEVFKSFVNQKVNAFAAFSEVNYELSPKLRLALGLRYTVEEKEFSINRFERNPADQTDERLAYECPNPSSSYKPCADPKEDWSKLTPRVTVDYKVSDDLMAYASYSQGFRSGGWVGRAATETAIGTFEPEVLDSYETGFRSEWLDNSLRINGTVFYMEYTDKQEDFTIAYTDVFGTASTTSKVENGASATVKGLELEIRYSPTLDLIVRSALGLLDAEYDKYNAPEGPNGSEINVADQRHYRFAPDYTFSLGADYFFEISGNEFVLTANYKYTDEFWVTPLFDSLNQGRDQIKGNDQLDLSINATFDNVKVSIFGDNITQSHGRVFRKFDGGAYHFGDKEVGRTFGITFGVEF